MSKVKAPLLSISASGKIADSIVFGNWKGNKYARASALGYNMSGFNFYVQQYIAQGIYPTLP